MEATINVLIVVAGIILSLVLIVAMHFWDMTSPPSIRVPGKRAARKHKGEDTEQRQPKESLASWKSPNTLIEFVTLGCYASPVGLASWELAINLRFRNTTDKRATLYDMHASVYGTRDYTEKMLNMLHSAEVRLYETNSILEDGRVYELLPGEALPVRLKFEISRFEGFGTAELRPGPALCVFGLYLDYLLDMRGDSLRIRIPSDSIYCFQYWEEEAFQLIHLNKGNIQEYRRKHRNLGRWRLLRALSRLLGKHLMRIHKVS